MAHPHKNAIANMSASSLIGVIEESKMTYVRENLSIFFMNHKLNSYNRLKSMKTSSQKD